MTGKGCIIPDFRLLGNIWPICLLLVPTHSSPLIPPTWGVNFNNMFMCSFYKQRFQKRKKDSQVISVFLRFWYLHMQKLLKKCCWNWHKWSISPTCLCAAFTNKDSKSAKDIQVICIFLYFWDLHLQKLVLKHWWNWLEISLASAMQQRTPRCVQEKLPIRHNTLLTTFTDKTHNW